MRLKSEVLRPVETCATSRVDLGIFSSKLTPKEFEVLYMRLQGANREKTLGFTGMSDPELDMTWRKLANKAELFYGARGRER